jgi:hypothetical protein
VAVKVQFLTSTGRPPMQEEQGESVLAIEGAASFYAAEA